MRCMQEDLGIEFEIMLHERLSENGLLGLRFIYQLPGYTFFTYINRSPRSTPSESTPGSRPISNHKQVSEF